MEKLIYYDNNYTITLDKNCDIHISFDGNCRHDIVMVYTNEFRNMIKADYFLYKQNKYTLKKVKTMLQIGYNNYELIPTFIQNKVWEILKNLLNYGFKFTFHHLYLTNR